MANPYTQVTVVNYNASPPTDDGVQEAQNQVEWAKHKTKLGDPLKTALESVDTNVFNAFASLIATPAVPRGYIDGLILSNDTDADHDVAIAAGTCKSVDNDATMTLSATLTKQIDVSWAEGDDSGGFPTALSIANNTWYHVFVIAKADGTVDGGFDTSLSATNLLADATEYVDYRRIGSVLTDGSSNILSFRQRGSWFLWANARADVTDTNPGTSVQTVSLSVPPDVQVMVKMALHLEASGLATHIHVAEGGTLTVAASVGEFTLRNDIAAAGTIDVVGTVHDQWTDTSQQIDYDLDASAGGTVVRILTLGWSDLRGRDS